MEQEDISSSASQATPSLSTGEPYLFRFPATRVMVVEDGEDIETIDFDLPKQAEGCSLPENVESISRKTAEDLMRVIEGAKNAIVQYVIRSRNKIKQMESCIQEKDAEIGQLRLKNEMPPHFVSDLFVWKCKKYRWKSSPLWA